jgi:Flp pilus assembly protein TadG
MSRFQFLAQGSRADGERGAIGVLAAVLMLVVIGMGAVAVDVGQIYAERSQLQNGADAAALSVAQACYPRGTCSNASTAPDGSTWVTWAGVLANGNANDGASRVAGIDFSTPGRVTVTTSTEDGTSHAGFLTPMFANALRAFGTMAPTTVGASATVAMTNTPSGSSGFPLALSDACFDLSAGAPSGSIQKFSYKPSMTCTGPGGHSVPGGWGWLDPTPAGSCSAGTILGVAGSANGNDPPGNCLTTLTNWKTTLTSGGEVTAMLPVFSQASGGGNGASFTILGYATLQIYGWHFGNSDPSYEFRDKASELKAAYPTLVPDNTTANNLACNSPASQRCMIAQFIRFDSIDSVQAGPGGGQDFGTTIIALLK